MSNNIMHIAYFLSEIVYDNINFSYFIYYKYDIYIDILINIPYNKLISCL